MKKILVGFSIISQVFILSLAEKNLVATVIEHLMECVGQAPENFSMETCQEMIAPNNDNNQEKYKDCKCVAACTGEKMGLIDVNGNGVPEKLKYYAEAIEKDSVWKKEAEAVIEKCKDITGNGCDLAFNWITCALTNSEKSLEFIRVFVGGGGMDTMKNK